MFKKHKEINFWPSIADMILAIFVVFLILWLMQRVVLLVKLEESNAGTKKLMNDIQESRITVKTCKSAENKVLSSLEAARSGWRDCEGRLIQVERDKKICDEQREGCDAQVQELQLNKPPIIDLKEAEGFNFPTGSAKLSSEFEKRLVRDVLRQILEYKQNINVIEVIGHTDGETVSGNKPSNLDIRLEEAIQNQNVANLQFGSNADLGLMRALSVVFFLQKQSELSGIKFRAYSAAQTVLTDGSLAVTSQRSQDPSRRRIELRLTKLEK